LDGNFGVAVFAASFLQPWRGQIFNIVSEDLSREDPWAMTCEQKDDLDVQSPIFV
jgi:hypothetical protein